MDHVAPDQATFDDQPAAMPSSAMMAGMIVVGSTLVGAVLFRTHGYEVTPFSWELVRHFNIFFVVCELVVVCVAAQAGLDGAAIWGRVAKADKTALLIWLATFAIGSVLSQQPAYSLITVSSWPVHVLFGLSVWHLAGRTRMSTEQITSLTGAGIALVLVGLFAITAVHFVQVPDPALLPQGRVFWVGAIPGFMGVRLFGVVMAYAALFGAGVLLAGQRTRAWPLAAAVLMLGFGALCWSATRAAVPAFFAALFFLPLVAGCRPSRWSWLVVSGIISSAFFLSALVPAPDPALGTLSLFRGEAIASGDVTAGRMDIWRTAINAIVERPFTGHGEGSTRWLLDQETGMHVQPHNILLQVFLHWGAVAACAAIWLVGRMLLAMIAAVRETHALLPYAMIVVAAFTAALFDGALYYPQMVMLPVAALAFALARGRQAKAAPNVY